MVSICLVVFHWGMNYLTYLTQCTNLTYVPRSSASLTLLPLLWESPFQDGGCLFVLRFSIMANNIYILLSFKYLRKTVKQRKPQTGWGWYVLYLSSNKIIYSKKLKSFRQFLINWKFLQIDCPSVCQEEFTQTKQRVPTS